MGESELKGVPWKKKRWWAAAAVLLIVAYPSSAGPVCYAIGRGWLPVSGYALHDPLWDAIEATGDERWIFEAWDFRDRWFRLGKRHAASD